VVEETKEAVLEMLKRTVRPEFLNRVDEIVVFAPLKEHEIEQIVRIQLNAIGQLLAGSGIELQYTDEG